MPLWIEYASLFSLTSLKQDIVELIRHCRPSIDEIFFALEKCFFKDLEPSLRNLLMQQAHHYHNALSSRTIPYTYKLAGVSARLLPASQGLNLISMSSIVRKLIFEEIGKFSNLAVVDCDLTSAFMSILLSVHKKETQALREMVYFDSEEGEGLWDYIRLNDFKDFPHLWDKKAVKICIYGSLFGGGRKAFKDAMIKSTTKELSIKLSDLKNNSQYQDLYAEVEARADTLVNIMDNSRVVNAIRDVFKIMRSKESGTVFQSPCGYSFTLNEDTRKSDRFRELFPRYMQGYEFSIIALTSLLLYRKYPNDIEFLLHIHDGNVFVCKADKSQYFSEQASLCCQEACRILNIDPPVGLEYVVYKRHRYTSNLDSTESTDSQNPD
jgi:hypothetical protein